MINFTRKGFTLIELLIVIAILGILAVAVLSAINPVEQIRKANDSRRKSNAAELLNALERYFTTYGSYPAGFSGLAGAGIPPGTRALAADIALLKDEVKSEFGTRISKADNYLYVYKDSNELVHICHQIESTEQKTKYGTSIASGSNYLACLPE